MLRWQQDTPPIISSRQVPELSEPFPRASVERVLTDATQARYFNFIEIGALPACRRRFGGHETAEPAEWKKARSR